MDDEDDPTSPARIARLSEVAAREEETIRGLEGCVARLHEVQQAKAALTGLSSAQIRAGLEFGRAALRKGLA